MNNRHPLGQLIKTVQDANGWSERQLEEKASGKPGLGKSNISKIKNHPLVSIKGVVIKGLADLLGVPEAQVARAALESMGVELTTVKAESLEDAVRNEAELAGRDRRILLAVLTEMKQEVKDNETQAATVASLDRRRKLSETAPSIEDLERNAAAREIKDDEQ